jgi:multidrug resistance efflux pump
MGLTSKRILWGTCLLTLLVLAVPVVVLAMRPRDGRATVAAVGEAFSEEREPEASRTPVKTVRPKRDPSFVISVQQLASVEAFFQVDLRARVAGQVKYVQKDIGDRVTKGEVLAEIDVPDLVQEVAQKETVIEQRKKDLKLAKAQVKFARAAVDMARNNIEQKKAEVKQEEATRDFRKIRWDRYKILLQKKALEPLNVEEEERDYMAAVQKWEAARFAVLKAEADWQEKDAGLETAIADVELKEALIAVAEKDRDKAQALADYAKITAPFDGVITSRNVDVGAFVQNAASGQTEPLISVARTDIVTVVMKVPDNVAPLVTRDTDAVIEMDELPGVSIRGKVTRFSPSIQNKDRTMRVEVDLYNGTQQDYRRFLLRSMATYLAPLGAQRPGGETTLAIASRSVGAQNLKGSADPFPLLPTVTGKSLGGPRLLLPGMSGWMRLLLHKFQNTYLLPSSTVFNKGGKPYLLVVKEGVSHLVQVQVQLNDGKLAKVEIIVHRTDPRLGEHESLEELTGDEEVIVSRQVEIGEGQAVKTTLESW